MPGLNQRFFQPVNFLRQLCLSQLALADDRTVPAKNQKPATADAGRNRDTPEAPFAFVQRLCHGPFLNEFPPLEKQFLRPPRSRAFALLAPKKASDPAFTPNLFRARSARFRSDATQAASKSDAPLSAEQYC